MLLWEAVSMVIPAAMLGLAGAAALTPLLPKEVRNLTGSDSALSLHTTLTAIGLALALSVIISIVPALRMWRMPVAAGLARE
jgi:ABC-type lipoprotein release transport system permease subunit